MRGDTIHVRRAGKKQRVVTLDGQEREIEADDLVIADSEVPVALAGVMGLANSQVRAQTRSLLLESAFFSPLLVRRTSRRLGLVSESSYRFEREADYGLSPPLRLSPPGRHADVVGCNTGSAGRRPTAAGWPGQPGARTDLVEDADFRGRSAARAAQRQTPW
jgi:hypothetical protein